MFVPGSFDLRCDRIVRLLRYVAREQTCFQCGERRVRIRRLGIVVPHSCAESTFTPLILPPVSASAKFMRPSSADELTQVSAFME